MLPRRPIGRLFVSGVLLFAATQAAEACAPRESGTVAVVRSVHDGDTFTLDDGTRVRLIGIDTPELARNGVPAQAFAREARGLLARLLPPGARVSLVREAEPRDRYGRALAHAVLPDGSTVQSHLLAAGLAVAIIIPPNDTLARCYRELEGRARAAGAGLWTLPERAPLATGKVPRDTRGYRLVRGFVKAVERNRRGLRLRFEGGLSAHVTAADLRRFPANFFEGLEGRRVLVRGWVARAGRGLSLRVRHPLDLQAVPDREPQAAWIPYPHNLWTSLSTEWGVRSDSTANTGTLRT